MILLQFGEKAYNFLTQPIEKDARINILEGSVRSGKTVCMIPKVLLLVEHFNDLGVITGVSKDTIYDNVLRDLFDVVGTENYTYNRQTGELTLFGKSIKVIGAKDEGSEKYLRGKTLAWAYCDELSLMPEKFFKQLLNRLSVKGAKLYGTTNPDSPYHFLYVEYINNQEKISDGMVKVYHFELDDNPNLDDEYKDFIRKAYAGLWYKRMIEGLWVLAEGAIYDMFDDKKHVVKEIPRMEHEWIGIDYGTANPTVFLRQGFAKGAYYTIAEYYYDSRAVGRQKTDVEYSRALQDFTGGKRLTVIVDPSAASFIAQLRKDGFMVLEADNSVLDGIRFVSSMLERDNYFIYDKCINTIKEKSAYVWDEKAQDRGEDKPLKTNDHCSDAERYGLYNNRWLIDKKECNRSRKNPKRGAL